MRVSLFSIMVCVFLMMGVVYIISTTLIEERAETKESTIATDLTPSIPAEKGVFVRSTEALSYKNMPEGNRTLAQLKKNRAYPGAPPMIPHPLLSQTGIGEKDCLQCHKNGGYASQFNAFTPIAPHPEFLNCLQCHVPNVTKGQFKGTNWVKPDFVKMNQRALQGSPPMIPHTLQLRDNCLACHAGSAAPKEIRVSHPERINCKQCHLPIETNKTFVKPEAGKNLSGNSIGHNNNGKLDNKEVAQIKNWINKE